MKKRSTRESCVFTTAFHWYITCSIPVSGCRARSSGQRYTRKKKHVKNRVKFKQTCREVQVVHAVHFRRICFAIKAERMIPPFSKLFENGQEQKKPSTRIFFAFSVAFQRYIICPIPIKFVEITAKIRFKPFSKLT